MRRSRFSPTWFARLLCLSLALFCASCETLEEFAEESQSQFEAPPPAPPEGVECWQSFSSFKRAMEARGQKPPAGVQWHHIAEQTLNRKRFANRLHCTDNLIAIPEVVHHKLNGHYSSKPAWAKGKRVRDEVSGWPWEKQYQYGLERLRKEGITP